MEETEEQEPINTSKRCTIARRTSSSSSSTSSSSSSGRRRRTNNTTNHYQLPPLFHYSTNQLGLLNQNHNQLYGSSCYYPPLLPPPPMFLLQLALTPPPPLQELGGFRPNSYLQKPTSSDTLVSVSSAPRELKQQKSLNLDGNYRPKAIGSTKQEFAGAMRPDSGGVEGTVIPLLANHFLVKFDPSSRIFHYNMEISPNPSKELARVIKQKLVEDNSDALSGCPLAYDGRKNLYSPCEFLKDRVEFYISLPIPSVSSSSSLDEEVGGLTGTNRKLKLFRVSIKLVSKLDGKKLSCYLNKESNQGIPLPQDYLQALDVILREGPLATCMPVGRSLHLSSMGDSKDIGGGVVGSKGFFQSLRPTQQGLALNVDLAVTAFHESIGVIPYLQKSIEFLHDLPQRKTRSLVGEERQEVEKALRNIRVFVCHRETVQRYRVYGLTEEATEDLWFADRDGTKIRLLSYYKEHYNHDIQFRNLPCLQISRSKLCYLPMELCMICKGQKFLGKLSDDQTARMLKLSCQKPKERRAIIDGIMRGPAGLSGSGKQDEFKLDVSMEMTRLNGRILCPPKLKLGDGGHVRDLIPFRHDRQWNLLNSHVFEGTKIERWAVISFGGTPDQKSSITKFINQLSQRCQQLGIFLNRSTITGPIYESTQVLNNFSALESSLRTIQRAASDNLQLLICIMEKKHKGYASLKRIAETKIGVISQCCLYPNLSKLSSQFLANLALKINAKVGGCTVALYNSLPSHIPRIFCSDEPVIFMGADVTHPHPLDDCSPSVAAVVGSMNWPVANKYISRIRSQTHRQEIIQDLCEMVEELLVDFRHEVSKLPSRIVFFRDGVSETQFNNVLQEELKGIREACSKFPDYNPPITFSVVQKRHHTRLFPDENNLPPSLSHLFDENVPPGTVVDTVVTHPREFDFYLCSHWGAKGTSRPARYHVLWDENQFTSDELQKLVYYLCFTFVRCTKPVSLVPPVYYAHLAAYRGRLYLERPESTSDVGQNATTMSRPVPPKAMPLPMLSDKLKKLMFYC